jgi:hypothetical protein
MSIPAFARTLGSFAGRRISALVEGILIYLLAAMLAGLVGLTALAMATPPEWTEIAARVVRNEHRPR